MEDEGSEHTAPAPAAAQAGWGISPSNSTSHGDVRANGAPEPSAAPI